MGNCSNSHKKLREMSDSKSEQFSKNGIKLSFLITFITDSGGWAKLKGLTTAEICANFVKPITLTMKCSFCELLKSQNNPAIRPASIFVCHTWSSPFLDVVDALIYHFREDPDVIIWIDLFSINQHFEQGVKKSNLNESLKAVMSNLKKAVLVMSKWNDSKVFTRG